jgi:tripartite-type tricarboxylate transporter receptor subunit TctC
MQMMESPDFLAEAKTLSLDVSPLSGEEVQALVRKVYETTSEIILPVRAIMTFK